MALTIWHGDNLPILRAMPDAGFDLIYIDPPFNTGRDQRRLRIASQEDPDGTRSGFHGRRYRARTLGAMSYADRYDDYLAFITPRLTEARRLLAPQGSLFVHLDFREVHHVKVWLDGLFGRAHFQNEIIWAYDYGARTRKRWPAKHDKILWYSRDPRRYTFNIDECDRIPYMAPTLVGAEKAARGKLPTDTWWHTIVSPQGRERTGYPSQKPRGIIDRIVKVHSNPGDRLLDFFAGSGTTGESALAHGRACTLIDSHAEALRVMERRFAGQPVTWHGWTPAETGAETEADQTSGISTSRLPT